MPDALSEPTESRFEIPARRLEGLYVAVSGRLDGWNKKDAHALIRDHGATLVSTTDERVNLVVVGSEQWPLSLESSVCDWLAARASQGKVEVINENQLLERLGLIDDSSDIRQLYTPTMLARLLDVPTATIRRWHRQGLLLAVHEVHRLPYFDFQEVISARRIAQLLAAGVSAVDLERKLKQLATLFPDVERPLAQLAIIVEGRRILLRDGEGLVDARGQRHFDFSDEDTSAEPHLPGSHAAPPRESAQTISMVQPEQDRGDPSVQQLIHQAAQLEADGYLEDAINTYRSVLLIDHTLADAHFLLAELLYRCGETAAARERYFVALELDEDYVEARANLGCVLAETGHPELAIAAFEGALARHPEYADVLFHLARTLDDVGRQQEAWDYWRRFLALAPHNPWATEARDRLGIADRCWESAE